MLFLKLVARAGKYTVNDLHIGCSAYLATGKSQVRI